MSLLDYLTYTGLIWFDYYVLWYTY